jgi:hypothetical protein
MYIYMYVDFILNEEFIGTAVKVNWNRVWLDWRALELHLSNGRKVIKPTNSVSTGHTPRISFTKSQFGSRYVYTEVMYLLLDQIGCVILLLFRLWNVNVIIQIKHMIVICFMCLSSLSYFKYSSVASAK